jgi:hypothetical protein
MPVAQKSDITIWARRAARRARRARRPAIKRLRRQAKLLRRQARALPKRIERARRAAYRLYNRRLRWTYARDLSRIPSREELPALLNRRRLVGDGAEIGVKLGKYSDFLLARWNGRRLISIDPWLEAPADEYVDGANVAQARHEDFHARTRERLERYGPRSEIWRLTSLEAAGRVPDAGLDFAYIDARHDYDSVLEDLGAWFPKVRPGGIIAGHDYADVVLPNGIFGVKSAVDEFFGVRGIRVHSTEGRQPAEMFPSWIVEVPGPGPS